MTDTSSVQISVLYGSQTGNAESIAEALYGALKASHGHQSLTLSTLNAAKARHLNGSTHIYIIVCSTTGNADPPENAEAWYRSVKLRSNVLYSYLLFILRNNTDCNPFCPFLSGEGCIQERALRGARARGHELR